MLCVCVCASEIHRLLRAVVGGADLARGNGDAGSVVLNVTDIDVPPLMKTAKNLSGRKRID